MRKLRLLATLVPLVAIALPAAAQLEKFKDWDQSPEFVYYATEDEQKAWKGVTNDADAQKFNNLFWGKRHPNYQTTAQNAFRQRFDALAAKADELFSFGKPGEKKYRRGALTERGKVLILLGPPKAIASRVGTAERIGEAEESLPGVGGTMVQTQFQYEQAQLAEWTGLKKLNLTFTVDQTTYSDSVDKPADVKKVWKKAVAAAVVNPKMTEPPVYKTREEYEAEQKAAAEAAAEAAKGPVLAEPVRAALEALLAKEPHGPLAVFPIDYGDGAARLMVQVVVPGSAVTAPAPAAAPAPAEAAAAPAPAAAAPAPGAGMKLALLVKAKGGKDAARREEAPALHKVKDDWYVDWSLPIEAGEYDVAAILYDAAGAEKLTARYPVTVSPLPTEFAISPLLIAATDLPAEGAKGDEPFVFSVRKFIGRGGNRLEKTDGLAYVARVYNPAIDPATKKLQLRRTISIKPKNGSTIDVPQPADEPMVVPEQQGATTALVIDLAGAIVDVNLGDYFRPGEYALNLKITDVVSGKSVEAKTPFTLVAPPAPAAPAAPAAKAPAKPAPKK